MWFRHLTAFLRFSILAALIGAFHLHAQQTGVPYLLFNGLSGVMGVPDYCVSNGCPVQTQTFIGLTQQLWSLQATDGQGFFN